MPRRNDFDTAWKEAITKHFRAFLQFFFPAIALEIDWSVEPICSIRSCIGSAVAQCGVGERPTRSCAWCGCQARKNGC